MFARLPNFFSSGDPTVKLADGLDEFEAASYQEMLANDGVIAMKKNMDAISTRLGGALTFATNNFALFVKQSDVERSIDILGSLLDGKLSRQAAEARRETRRS